MIEDSGHLLVFDDVEGGELLVSPQCPLCGKFVKRGRVMIRPYDGKVKFELWTCSVHGEIQPYWTRM